MPLDIIAELVNIGTLSAFIIVALGILVLRKVQPMVERPFRCPLMPVIPVLCILSCGYLIYVLPDLTKVRFALWMALGLLMYFIFGMKNSRNSEKPIIVN
jgi:APA family basic amino acid/polyamine antiporter